MGKFTIIENSDEAEKAYGINYGAEYYSITPKQIDALKKGKQLASTINNKEYTIFIDFNRKD